MKICVQGLWHLGSVTAAALASVGHQVSGLDTDIAVVDGLRKGKAPLFEPGLDSLLTSGLDSGRLEFHTSAREAVADIEVLWITYDTPVDDDDKADVGFVLTEIENVLPLLPLGTTILVSSQLPVGTIAQLERTAATLSARNLNFAYSPENLRLGKALDVFLNPDRIVVGVRTQRDRIRIEQLLHPITNQIVWMCVESAEMTKHAINAFLATSVTFANEIASICELVGADAKEVELGLKSEKRIGPGAYLSPGGAFSGGTLARDISFLSQIGRDKGLAIPLLSSVKPSNDEHKLWTRRQLAMAFPSLRGLTIAVWGLTYKPGTSTLRRSLAVELCDWLLQEEAKVQVHDPAVSDLPLRWNGQIRLFDDPLAALHDASVLIVATEWPNFKQYSSAVIARTSPNVLILDANRFLASPDPSQIRYLAVGSPHKQGISNAIGS